MGFDLKLTLLPILILTLNVAACSLLGSATVPEDMSVEDHRRQARKHATEANKHRSRYNPAVRVGPGSGGGRWGPDYDYRYSGDSNLAVSSYNPSERHLTHAKEHEAQAQRHRRDAQALERFEEAQCGLFSPEIRAMCPLLGQLVSVEDIPNGSRVRFADGVDVKAAVAHMRCHIAFARSRARAGMDSCPLYVEGVGVSRVEQGFEVDFLVEGTNELDALRKRMRRHVAPEPR